MTTGGMQHEMRRVLSALFCLLVEESVVNGGGKCNMNCGGCCQCMLFISLYLLLSMPVVYASWKINSQS